MTIPKTINFTYNLFANAYLEYIQRLVLLLLHDFYQYVYAVRQRESPSSCTPFWSTTTDQVTHYEVTSFQPRLYFVILITWKEMAFSRFILLLCG